jgi:hypothetical protein
MKAAMIVLTVSIKYQYRIYNCTSTGYLPVILAYSLFHGDNVTMVSGIYWAQRLSTQRMTNVWRSEQLRIIYE